MPYILHILSKMNRDKKNYFKSIKIHLKPFLLLPSDSISLKVWSLRCPWCLAEEPHLMKTEGCTFLTWFGNLNPIELLLLLPH